MKILIFENEFVYVDTPFEYINDVYYDNSIEYTVFAKSQDLKSFKSLKDFDHVFVDISLALNSELDGYGILKKIESESLNIKSIVIMTGNHLIKESLISRELTGNYKILTKPIDFSDLLKVLRS